MTQALSAIILIDPVSSGRHLKLPVVQSGHQLIAVFTLTPEELKTAGKHLPLEEKHQLCDRVIYAKTASQILEQLDSAAQTIVAVIPASEPAVELADLLAHQLGLKGHAPQSSAMRRDKFAMRSAVRRAGLNGPDFAACHSVEEALEFARSHDLPVVAKTPKGAGAHHVFVCRTLEEVASSFDAIVKEKNIFGDASNYALIEEFISGQQYVVELFGDGQELHLFGVWRLDVHADHNNRIIFDKMAVVTDTGALSALQTLVTYAKEVGHALGAKWGPCVVEIRDHPIHGPLLIEAGIRLSGIDLPVLIRASSNFDPFQATIDAYLSPEIYDFTPVAYHKHACLVFCPTEAQGTVGHIEGLESIQSLTSLVQSHLYAKLGEPISPSRDLATIPLYVYLAHEDRNQLQNDISAVRRLFKVRTIAEPRNVENAAL